MWKNAPKDYVSTAVLKVDITPPYVEAKALGEMVKGILNDEESKVLANLKSTYFLNLLVEKFEANSRWKLDGNEALNRMRRSVSFEMDEKKQLFISATQNSPEGALELAEVVVGETIPGLAELSEQRTEAGLELLGKEVSYSEQLVSDAKAELAAALKNIGAPVEPKVGMNLNAYLIDPGVLSAKIAWDAALKEHRDRIEELNPMRRHWERKVRPAVMAQAPQLPTEISGPLKKPYQTQGAVSGVTVGLALGLLAMLMCWKIFS